MADYERSPRHDRADEYREGKIACRYTRCNAFLLTDLVERRSLTPDHGYDRRSTSPRRDEDKTMTDAQDDVRERDERDRDDRDRDDRDGDERDRDMRDREDRDRDDRDRERGRDDRDRYVKNSFLLKNCMLN